MEYSFYTFKKEKLEDYKKDAYLLANHISQTEEFEEYVSINISFVTYLLTSTTIFNQPIPNEHRHWLPLVVGEKGQEIGDGDEFGGEETPAQYYTTEQVKIYSEKLSSLDLEQLPGKRNLEQLEKIGLEEFYEEVEFDYLTSDLLKLKEFFVEADKREMIVISIYS